MRIHRVEVTYGELRSSGYPSFSNKRHEISLRATLEPGDSAKSAVERLHGYAKAEVQRLFGDAPQGEPDDMTKPYVKPE